MIGDAIFNSTNTNETLIGNDFRSQVQGGWSKVYPPIRARMDRLLTSNEPVIFEGTGCVRRSKTGFIFAYIAKLFGTPLVFKKGENVKTSVTVAPTKNANRCWHRLFEFEDGSKQLIQTTKIIDSKLGFLDAVGAEGERKLATQMKLWSQGNSLYFESTMYLLRFKYFTLKVPSILTPGKLFAEHRDLGNGNFRYILKFNHPIWGETFYQNGIFRMLD